MDLSVVIPLYNESESIVALANEITNICQKIIIHLKLFLLMMVVQMIRGKKYQI